MDDDRLKQVKKWDYFDEWLERIRDIRASEKRFYQKIRDIYATAIDYDKISDQAQIFFKKVQNKMLWATTGMPRPQGYGRFRAASSSYISISGGAARRG